MRVLILTGGTGGHLYPALMVGEELKKRGNKIIYICSQDKLDYQILHKMNVAFFQVASTGFSGNLLKKLNSIKNLLKSVKKIRNIIKKEEIEVVVSFGGYIGISGILAGSSLKKLLFLHEQNAIAGMSNRLSSFFVSKSITSYQNTKLKNKIFLGNPRSSFNINENKTFNYLDDNKKKVLFVSGSLGSKSLNKIFFQLATINKDFQIIIITGNNDYSTYQNIRLNDTVFIPYEKDLVELIHKVDAVVTRAGATIISEIQTAAIPAIFIPSPNVTKNHQYYNALEMVNNNMGMMIEERVLNTEILYEYIRKILDPIINYRIRRELSSRNSANSLIDIISLIEKEYQEWTTKN